MTRMPSPAAEQAVAATKPRIDRENDPRNPRKRLEAFFDDGTLELITAEDTSGILCAVGPVRRHPGRGLLLGRDHPGWRDGP